ncbi:MAG TPA: hypothetical protein VN736_28675, partial [Candidatus Limnocylindrales bacterium]|nr:hypothetical protein [Candidatus Limnocylindrales bacterium]
MNRRAEIERLHEPILERLRAIQEEFGPLNREYADAWRVARQFNKTERDAAIAEGRSEDEALAAYPYGRVDFSPEKFQRWEDLRKAATRIDRDELTPVAVRACVVRINGLTLQWDDESGTGQSGPATVDGLLEYGPTELYDEILVHVQHELGLSAGEKENLSSPSTSGAVEGGKSPSGSAAPAGTPEM